MYHSYCYLPRLVTYEWLTLALRAFTISRLLSFTGTEYQFNKLAFYNIHAVKRKKQVESLINSQPVFVF
jgi:hypothetical protein